VKILTVNTGSTSVRLGVVDSITAGTGHAAHYRSTGHDPDELLGQFLAESGQVDAVSHRVVHGGDTLQESCILNSDIETAISALGELAPLHNPLAMRWIVACRERLGVPQVAVFDTAYFAALPAVASTYAIPQTLVLEHGIRRYGFHGIAHRALWQRWCELRPELPAGGRLVSIQLGGGCSITAIREGAPQDTSMGFSPVEGLVMATRCGDIDPAVIIHLLRSGGHSAEQLEQLINTQSGLLGVSAGSADLLELFDDPDPQAGLAAELYCYRLRKYIGAYLAVLGGADGIVFGGGVGEHVPEVREHTLAGMHWCGIRLDARANHAARGNEACISSSASEVDVRVLPVDEAAILAVEASRVLQGKQERTP
jgi:acetate kinase